LELNPEHAIVGRLRALVEEGEAKQGDVERWSRLLFDQALLAEGTLPEDPAAFAKAVAELMQNAAR
jgi:molecular chaperone HtpG